MRPRIVYDDGTHKPVPCSDDKGCQPYKADGQTARCDIAKSKCAFFDFVCLKPDRCEATSPAQRPGSQGEGRRREDSGRVLRAHRSVRDHGLPEKDANKPDNVCRGATCDRATRRRCTPNQTCEALFAPKALPRRTYSHCEELTCDPDKDKATCCVAKNLRAVPVWREGDTRSFAARWRVKPDECCVHEKACSTVACPPHHVRSSAVFCEDDTKCKEQCCTRETFLCSLRS